LKHWLNLQVKNSLQIVDRSVENSNWLVTCEVPGAALIIVLTPPAEGEAFMECPLAVTNFPGAVWTTSIIWVFPVDTIQKFWSVMAFTFFVNQNQQQSESNQSDVSRNLSIYAMNCREKKSQVCFF
jgi:hypothetical protein